MSIRLPVLVLVLALLALVASSVLYRVVETEFAVKLRFGELVQSDIQPGLHFKAPVADDIRKVDTRILTLDARPESFYTIEKKRLEVDSFVKWQVEDVGAYYKATNGDEQRARSLLEDRINDNLRNEIGVRTLHEVVSGERDQIMSELTKSLGASASKDLGIRIIDVRVKRIDFPQEVSSAVYR